MYEYIHMNIHRNGLHARVRIKHINEKNHRGEVNASADTHAEKCIHMHAEACIHTHAEA